MTATTATTATAAPAPGTSSSGRAELVRGLLLDVGGSVAAYYALHAMGVADTPALLGAAVVSGGRVAWVAIRDRSLNAFATVMLVVWGVGLALSLVTGDPRFLLLKESVTTGAVGVAFLVSVLVGRPLTLSAAQSFNPGRAAELARLFTRVPAARRGFVISSLVWGAGLLTEAAVRIPLVYALPVSVMVGLSTAIMIAAFGALGAWNVWYTARLQRRAARA